MTEYGRHADVDDTFLMAPSPEDPADHLDGDPFKDDLTEQLAARRPQRWANRTTVVIAGLVLLVGGFVAGAQVEKNFGHVNGSGSNTPNPFASGFNRGTFGGGNGTGSSTAGNGTTGTVKLVDGTTVYITTANGDVVTVKTDGSTSIQVSQPGSLKDLPVGATVTVTGADGADGSVNATKITKDK